MVIGDSSPVETTIVGCCSHCNAVTKSFESHNPKLTICNSDLGSKKRHVAAWDVTESFERTLRIDYYRKDRYIQEHPASYFLERRLCAKAVSYGIFVDLYRLRKI